MQQRAYLHYAGPSVSHSGIWFISSCIYTQHSFLITTQYQDWSFKGNPRLCPLVGTGQRRLLIPVFLHCSWWGTRSEESKVPITYWISCLQTESSSRPAISLQTAPRWRSDLVCVHIWGWAEWSPCLLLFDAAAFVSLSTWKSRSLKVINLKKWEHYVASPLVPIGRDQRGQSWIDLGLLRDTFLCLFIS